MGNPTYPNILAASNSPTTGCPGADVTVFDKNYHNPRIYGFDIAYEQQIAPDYVAFVDFADSKGVYLTRFLDPNVGPVVLPGQVVPETGKVYSPNADTVCYRGGATNSCPNVFAPGPFANLGSITNTNSGAKSLYSGVTFGIRKRYSHHFQFEAQYTYSQDRDNDTNERDPFTFRYANLYNLAAEYSLSDRDEAHNFNAFGLGDLPCGFKGNFRIQQHSAQPQTHNVLGSGTGAPCSSNNSLTRFVNGVDCGRNHLRKNNAFFILDFGIARPFKFHDRYELVPRIEVFNTRVGVGDPLQAQLSLRFVF